jgi:hypothetical protein
VNNIENYIIKVLGADKNTAATIITTLTIFLLSQLLVGGVRIIKSYFERKKYRNSILFIIDDFAKSCQKQYKTVTKSIPTISSDTESNIIVNTIALNSISYLNNLDLYNFTKKFKRIIPAKNYSKSVSILFSILSQIKVLNESENAIFEKFTIEYRKYLDLYYEGISKLSAICVEFSVLYQNKKVVNREFEYIAKYIDIFQRWDENGQKKQYKFTYTLIVQEIDQLNKQYNDVLLVLRTYQYTTICYRGYINMINGETHIENSLKHFAHAHRRASILISKVILPNLKYGWLRHRLVHIL